MADVLRAVVVAALLVEIALLLFLLTGGALSVLFVLIAVLAGSALFGAAFLLLGRRPGEDPYRDLGSGDPRVRYLAASALGDSSNPEAVGPLKEALADPDEGVRWAALEALGKIGTPALPVLTGLLGAEDVDLRWGAAVALGEVGDAAAVGPLAVALGDPDRYVRTRAALALAAIGSASCDVLAAAAESPDAGTRWAAALALGRIPAAACVPALRSLLGDPDPGVRWKTAEALGTIGNDDAVATLVPLLGDPDPEVKAGAVAALVGIGAGAAPAVVESLKVRDRWFGAVDVLREMGAPVAGPALRAALGRKNPWVRIGAAMVLAEEGDRAGVDTLFAALDDPDPDVRDAARQTLSAGIRREGAGAG